MVKMTLASLSTQLNTKLDDHELKDADRQTQVMKAIEEIRAEQRGLSEEQGKISVKMAALYGDDGKSGAVEKLQDKVDAIATKIYIAMGIFSAVVWALEHFK